MDISFQPPPPLWTVDKQWTIYVSPSCCTTWYIILKGYIFSRKSYFPYCPFSFLIQFHSFKSILDIFTFILPILFFPPIFEKSYFSFLSVEVQNGKYISLYIKNEIIRISHWEVIQIIAEDKFKYIALKEFVMDKLRKGPSSCGQGVDILEPIPPPFVVHMVCERCLTTNFHNHFWAVRGRGPCHKEHSLE